MTDITINLKDFITFGFLLVTAVGLWFKIRRLNSNHIGQIRKDLAKFQEKYNDDRVERAREMGILTATLSGLETRFDKHLNQK